MSCLPPHGPMDCSQCHGPDREHGVTIRTEGDWRLHYGPNAWGNPHAEIVALGFSRGPNVVKHEAKQKSYNDRPFAGQRQNVAKILAHVGLIPRGDPAVMRRTIDASIADPGGRFAWGSLIRCGAEQRVDNEWISSGGNMLGRFVEAPFGMTVAENCIRRHLGDLPRETRLVLLFGMGPKLRYVAAARHLIKKARPSRQWSDLSEIAYRDERVTFVHLEHFAVQGSLLSDWLGLPNKEGKISPRSHYGKLAQAAVRAALPA